MSQNIVMRPIRWLHISDIHMRISDAWSQDVVLKAMCDHIARQHADGVTLDFILATGDLAFSGQVDEYKLAASFFDALSEASGVVKDNIFCVPGNHDVDRERQKICFHGARTLLQNENQVDLLLSPAEDLETLRKREEAYRQFQASYFEAQDRICTADGLGYVSCISLGEVRIAILGLDSAWLAEGGMEDHGKVLIGERQVINALEQANTLDPHIVIGMAHHPFHLFLEFDRQIVQNRIQRACRFFHCGHLHELESSIGYSSTSCLTFSAGASFKTRHSQNTYSIVTLDLLNALSTVHIAHYNPREGCFSITPTRDYRFELPAITCSITELAQVMEAYSAKLAPWSHYLSALLLDQKGDLPILVQNNCAFGSIDVIQGLTDNDLKQKTFEFMSFKNVLRVFYKRVPLSEIFVQHGAVVEQYVDFLRNLSSKDSELKSRLAVQEKDAKSLANAQPHEGFSHTTLLLQELADDGEWELLRGRAQRHMDSPDPTVAIHAKRMLALSLAHSEKATDKKMAIQIYRSLTSDRSTDFTDAGNLAILLMEVIGDDGLEEAKKVLLNGIGTFPLKASYYLEIGHMIVKQTGDKNFRRQLESAVEERGKSD